MTVRRRRSLMGPATIGALAIVALSVWGGASASAAPASAASAAPSSSAALDLSAVDLSAIDLSGKNYVALGDSYSAGFGLTPYSDSPAPGCYQADENYPHLVAAALGLNLTDVTCSGAVTANIIGTPQVTITGQGTAQPQSLALNDSTDIVTVTIGGNDLGFADVAQACFAFSPAGPTLTGFNTCKERYDPDGVDTLAYKIDHTVSPALNNTFALIRQKAPNAKVFVIGYPTIAPDVENTPADGCFTSALGNGSPPYPANAFPYTATDTQYLHATEAKLDKAIHDNAVANGATYIDTLPLTESHSACAASGDAYVNGVSLVLTGSQPGTPLPPMPAAPENVSGTAGGSGTPEASAAAQAAKAAPVISTAGLSVKLGALHPNAAGVAFLDSQVTTAIQNAFALTGDPSPSATPTPTPAASSSPTSGAAAAAGTGAGSATLAATGRVDVIPLTLGAIILLLAGLVPVLLVARHRTDRDKPHYRRH